jgi:hypothetical protein
MNELQRAFQNAPKSSYELLVTHLKAATKEPAATSQLPVESDSFLSTVVEQPHLKTSVGGTTHALCFAGTLCCYVQCLPLWYLHFKPVL